MAQQKTEAGLRQSPAQSTSGAERNAFALHLKPKVAQLLAAFNLDVVFHRAEGDWLYYYDKRSVEIAVLDIVGGFGAGLFGHNHPALVDTVREVMSERRPFNAQASVRGPAAMLASRLSAVVGRTTGKSYVATLANSGTEAVEASIKHAELETSRRRAALLDRLREDHRRLSIGLRDGSLRLSAGFERQAAAISGGSDLTSTDQMLTRLRLQAERALESSPRFVAVEGAFHGKSTGSLKLTYRDEFRSPWNRIGVSVIFIPRDDLQAIEALVHSAVTAYPALVLGADGEVTIERREISDISACFCEPVQGEGGIHALSRQFLTALRLAADRFGFPLVFDEIQCGMGRCGTFLAGEATGVGADYYLLSKSLGGGLVKIAALLVDSDRYEYDFAYLHTSTFADDDLSSSVALRALDLIEEGGQALIGECRRKGDFLRERLIDLQNCFPDQVSAVRGRGLMLGVELAPQNSSDSPLLRVLSEQNLLCYLAAGYLFNVHRVRIAPTLAHRAVLRIEPSVYVSEDSLKQFCHALERFLTLLRDAGVGELLSFLATPEETIDPLDPPLPVAPRSPAPARVKETRSRVGFLVNFTGPGDLRHWESRLRHFSEADCDRFLDQTQGLLDPFVLDETEMRSATGGAVDLMVIGVPFTPAQAMLGLRQGDNHCAGLVRKAVYMACDSGCSVVGLGGHTSIVTDSGRSLVEDRVNLTTGNSLTVAAAAEALLQVAYRRRLDPAACQLGVVGAGGNVGATLAELLAEEVGSVVLIGRSCSQRFLLPVAARIYSNAYTLLRSGGCGSPIARELAGSPRVQTMLALDQPADGQLLTQIMREERGDTAPVKFAETMAPLVDCQLIVSATNAPSPVIKAQHIGPRDTVICDVAVPRDVAPSLEGERPNATVIRGGILRAPLGQRLDIPALRLPGSDLYGCLAETIVLGLAGHNGHYSYGPVSAGRVRQVKGWALQHGFEVAAT